MPPRRRTITRRFRTGGPPLSPEERETGVERRSPRQPQQQQRVPRTTIPQLLDVAARAIIEAGDLEPFWDFVQEARRFGSIPPQWTDEVVQGILESNRQSLDRRIFALQEEFTMMGEPSEFGPEVSRRVFKSIRATRGASRREPPTPDDPFKRGSVFGE